MYQLIKPNSPSHIPCPIVEDVELRLGRSSVTARQFHAGYAENTLGHLVCYPPPFAACIYGSVLAEFLRPNSQFVIVRHGHRKNMWHADHGTDRRHFLTCHAVHKRSFGEDQSVVTRI